MGERENLRPRGAFGFLVRRMCPKNPSEKTRTPRNIVKIPSLRASSIGYKEFHDLSLCRTNQETHHFLAYSWEVAYPEVVVDAARSSFIWSSAVSWCAWMKVMNAAYVAKVGNKLFSDVRFLIARDASRQTTT